MIKEETNKELDRETTSNFMKSFFWVFKNPKFLLFLKEKNFDDQSIQLFFQKNRSKRRLIKNSKSILFVIGLLVIFSIITLAVFESWFSVYSKAATYTIGSWEPPSEEHPLGTTWGGQDILARLIFGVRYNLIIVISSTFISILLGIVIGLYCAYYGGWIDIVLMRIMDIISSFPGIVFAILFILIWGRNLEMIIIVLGIASIPHFSRIVKTCALKQKELPYIDAAKVSGAGKKRIMFRHILPNCSQPLIVSATFNFGKLLLSLAVLSFLRIYVPRAVDWGLDISLAINYFYVAPWATFWPMLMITLSIIGYFLIGDGLREIFSLKPEYL